MKKTVGILIISTLLSGCSSNLGASEELLILRHDSVYKLRHKDIEISNPSSIDRPPVKFSTEAEEISDEGRQEVGADSKGLAEDSDKLDTKNVEADSHDDKTAKPSVKEDLVSTKDAANQTHLCSLGLDRIFYDDYYNKSWPAEHTITWSVNPDSSFKEEEIAATKASVMAWDDIIEKVQFEEVDFDQSPSLVISYGEMKQEWGAVAAYWQSWWYGEYIYKSTITLGLGVSNYSNIDFFTNVMLHELGNVLGLGDIDPKTHGSFSSVMLDTTEFLRTELTDLDKCLIQKHYNEGEYIE